MPPTELARRRYAGRSSEERIQARRARFLAAGRQCFGTVGFRKTTVRLLCAEAGLTDRYFYESFDSVEALLVAVYNELVDAMEADILAALVAHPDSPLEIRIRHSIDALFQQAQDPLRARIIWFEVLGVSPGSEAIYNVTLRRFAELLFRLAKALLPPWPQSDAVVRMACLGLIGAASEMAKDWPVSDYEQPRETLVEALMLMFRGLVTTLASGGGYTHSL